MTLRIQVHQEDTEIETRKCCGQIHRDRGFAHTALFKRHCVNMRHELVLYFIMAYGWSGTQTIEKDERILLR
jgi:hypothetical protein